MAQKKHAEKIKKLGNDGLRAVKAFLRKGDVAGFNLGELVKNSEKLKKRAKARSQNPRNMHLQPSVEIQGTDVTTTPEESKQRLHSDQKKVSRGLSVENSEAIKSSRVQSRRQSQHSSNDKGSKRRKSKHHEDSNAYLTKQRDFQADQFGSPSSTNNRSSGKKQ